jgi:LysM repeat protein
MSCYACGRDAIQRCPRCAKPYCNKHGGELCAACQDPSSAIPSGAVFRGALLVLLVASVLALWLLIRPPGASDEESGAQAGQPTVTRTPTAAATTVLPSSSVTPTGTPGGTPSGSPTPGGTPGGTPGVSPTPGGTPGISPTPGGTPAATPTAAPSPTPAASPFIEYTVKQGDSLSSIAQQFGTTADELARINSITDPNSLSVGQKLQVPRPTSPSPTPSP